MNMAAPNLPVVLCTLPLDPAGLSLLEGIAHVVVAPDPSADTLRHMIGDADVLVVRSQLPADLFERPTRLRGVVRNGTGLDFIPVASASLHGIPVANVPGANAQAVVEYCIGGFLLLSRRFAEMDSGLRRDGWAAARALSASTSELSGKTVGIVGVGTIGASLAHACHYGFGMRVIGSQPRLDALPAFVEPVDIDTLFARSDFISLNCPLTDATRHLVDAQRLELMKPHAVLVNASRGAVIDDAALVDALSRRSIKGAMLDVFTEQPLPTSHPFHRLDNVVLTPHAAALTQESTARMSLGAARQVVQLLKGERPEHLVNPEVWGKHSARSNASSAVTDSGVSL
ncbi:hydroxyacid dehydrogenase [Paraburkholderia sp. MPAMCS5]|uniref:hydroxyacid dehydrogenase n=1 Tax=Paraburkholderia sp. MPAMCS5 TaxID=3112563 RepID=UPI002E17C6DA|nr:hydroxyacid dehydrogenase [Paraburkholderia sp. MPAMCS5]